MSGAHFDPTPRDPRPARGQPSSSAIPANLSGAIAERTEALQRSLRADGVPIAWSLTTADICMAALNGGSPFINYILPSIPQTAEVSQVPAVQRLVATGEMPKGLYVASLHRDPMYFQHCLNAAWRSKQIDDGTAASFIRDTFLTTTYQDYLEYLDILQNTAQAINRNLKKYCEPLADLIALQHVLTQAGIHPMSAGTPKIEILGEVSGKLYLRALDQENVLIPIRSGEVIVNVGAGYNSLAEVPRLAGLESRFILNDNDPFVAALIRKHLEYSHCPNIIADGSDMKDLNWGSAPVAGVIMSLTYSASENSVMELLSNMTTTAPGKPIVAVQMQEPYSGELSADKFQRCLNLAGFETRLRLPLVGHQTSLVPGHAHALVLSFDSEQILDFVGEIPSEGRDYIFELFVAKA